MAHPHRRQVIAMSILIEVDPNGKDNEHVQKAIDQWQIEYDRNDTDNNETKNPFGGQHPKDTNPVAWDPFHPSMERSLYHWGYWGSLTEPPCSTFVAWRVLTSPARISVKQLEQLRNILFTNRDENGKYTSVADPKVGVARPIQEFKDRKLYKCTPDDYVSDIEKNRMRTETGNPDWCC
eukprot:91483_1